MLQPNSLKGTLIVALVLCVVCSLVVSTAAVSLSSVQEANKALDKKKNVLLAAGLAEKSTSADEISRIFEESISEKLIDLDTGQPVSEDAGVDPATYDAKKAAMNPDLQKPLPEGALPGIPYREPYARVYEIQKEGQTDGYILPIYGKGLWSTLYGFIALEADKETVRGITYYSHAETPGLGGEVDNPLWKDLWPGKKVYEADSEEVALTVLKGKAGNNEYAVDGLSGATITTKGVDNMVKYWLGPEGFGKYLAQN